MILKKRITFGVSFFLLLLCSKSILHAQNSSKADVLLQIKNLRQTGPQTTESQTYVDLLCQLAKKYRYRHADSIKLLSEEALAIASKINYPRGKAYAILRKGDYYADTGREGDAIVEYNKSKDLAFALNYPELKAEVLKSIAFLEFLRQNLNNSVLTYYEGIDIASRNRLYEVEARLRHNLGYCYFSYKLYDEAQIEYLVADSLWNRVEIDHPLRAMTLSNIGLNAIEKGDIEFGNIYNNKSVELFKNTGEVLWLSRALRVRARYYLKKKHYEEAEIWIKSSDSLLKKLYNPRDQMQIDIIHADILTHLGRLDSAKYYSLKALRKSLDFKDSITQIKSYSNLEKIAEQTGHIDSAYAYYKKQSVIKSLLNENNEIQNTILLRAKSDFVKEKETIRLANLERRLTQQKYFQWSLGALVVSVIIAYIMYQSNRRERRLNKKLEEKSNSLAISESVLKKTNANQKTLFSIVGHDLKGPISSLRELLKVMSTEEDLQTFKTKLLPKLKNYTGHVHFTLENLLNWGKTQMKGEHIAPSRINVYAIASGVLDLYSQIISKKELVINLNMNKNLTAWADEEDIKVVFRNIISNALKFTQAKGSITIAGNSSNSLVTLDFQDNGVGMSSETQKLVFDSNTHYSTHGTNDEKGTGLGLMLCREIISRNNGEISMESFVNQGTKFTINLPQ